MWHWLMVRLPGGINQLIIEGLLAGGHGQQSGIMLDDITVQPCEQFSELPGKPFTNTQNLNHSMDK